MKNKYAAMELTMGTFVTVVLSISLLILAFMLMKTIIKSAKSGVDLTDKQMKDQINNLFSADSSKRISIAPATKILDVKEGSLDPVAFGFSIRNLIEGNSGAESFSYNVSYDDSASHCSLSKEQAMKFITLGFAGKDIKVLQGGSSKLSKIFIKIPVGAPLCLIRYHIDVYYDNNGENKFYDSDSFNIQIKPK